MEKLFWDIFNASDESELHELVQRDPLLRDGNNWFPYGGTNSEDTGNFGTFESQQPHPIPALVEKITNSIDTLLLKECRLRDCDPKSLDAPVTMSDAVELFFGIKKGDFSEVSKDDRRGIAENIQVIASGDLKRPNILIYDNGEGQHPDDFKDTFLSLHKKNKTDIHFVQGKYNFGSTGAVVFCGEHRYQLIASKLYNDLNKSGRTNEFGFTLVRRHPLSEDEEAKHGSSWYEYFVVDSKIPRFPISEIDVGLLGDRPFKSGSLVKLYSYQLPRGVRSDITLDLWRELNVYLYQPALPVLLYEKRFMGRRISKGKSPSKLLLGNKTRLIIDERDKKEITITLRVDKSEIGTINVEATVFKHGISQTEFIKNKAVIFTLNGQVHGSFPRGFISQSLGFTMLRDSLLINIDCTQMRTSFRQDLFMANRFNMKEGHKFEILVDLIVEKLKHNQTLKELNQNRKNQIIRDTTEDKELLRSLAKSLPMDNDLIRLLKKSGDLNIFGRANGRKERVKEKDTSKEPQKPYVSRRFPSVFKIDLKEKSNGKAIKSIPLNGKGIIKFETDVEDEYLFRPKEPGELQLQVLGIQNNDTDGGNEFGKPKKVEDVFDVTVEGPTRNSIRITFEPKKDVSVGDEIELNARLNSPEGDLEAIFYVKIVDPEKEGKKVKEQIANQPSLPTPVKVYEKKENSEDRCWQDIDPNWGAEDIVKIIRSDDNESIVEAIAINMDSYIVQRYISKNRIKSESEIRFVKNKYFTSVYFHSLFLFGIFDKLAEKLNENGNWDIEELVPHIFKFYSTCLLYLNTDEAILSSLNADL